MVLIVFMLLRFASDPLITLEAKLRKAIFFYNIRLIVFINIVLSLSDVDAIKAEEMIS
jgi:hypothetical protein